MARSASSTRRKTSGADGIKQEMLRILLRGRSETLGEACKAVGITPTTFYYRLKHAVFGSAHRGKQRKIALTSIEVKRLSALIRRQERLQRALRDFQVKILLG